MALILLIETATTTCSVALASGDQILALAEQNERNIHASHITLFIDEVMRQGKKAFNQLDAVAVSCGPGSYTGLRIGVSAAKGLCYALDIPLIAIDTLEAMAFGIAGKENYPEDILLCPMIDARRMEVYTAMYSSVLKPVYSAEARVLTDTAYDEVLNHHPLLLFGDGAEKTKPMYQHKSGVHYRSFQNSAAHLLQPAIAKFAYKDFENLADFEPLYLKEFGQH